MVVAQKPSFNGQHVEKVGAVVPSIRRQSMLVKLIGDSPLIVHAWSKKAKQQMLDKQMKKAKTAKEAKDPVQDFIESLHVIEGTPVAGPVGDEIGIANLDECVFGFPSVGFKSCAVSACRFVDGAKMTEARGAFHIEGELIPIECETGPIMREDMTRIGMGVADIRFRPEFRKWSVTFEVVYNASAVSPEQIINYFNIGGFGVGVGEWRPEKDGQWGRFHVATDGE